LHLQHLDIEYLDEILNYDLAIINSIMYQENRLVQFQHDPLPLIRALAKGTLLLLSIEGNFEIEITCDKNPSNIH
jgi:hypothetical protein